MSARSHIGSPQQQENISNKLRRTRIFVFQFSNTTDCVRLCVVHLKTATNYKKMVYRDAKTSFGLVLLALKLLMAAHDRKVAEFSN